MAANGAEERPVRQRLGRFARQLWDVFHRSLLGPRIPLPGPRPEPPPRGPLEPLRRVLLTDSVSRTLFEEYAAHRAADRGDEETGWVLLGLREQDQAVALATLPAGTRRDAGVAHVRFNSGAQALASRIVRQADRRLTMLGVVHTHPGSLRHPSDGDFQGDSQWVQQRRGGEGIFGIGTADAPEEPSRGALFARQPRPNVHCLGELCFSWYSLRANERGYRALPVELTVGPDLARPLHEVWTTLEEHAERLDRLYRQQAGIICNVVEEETGMALAVTIPLAEAGDAIRVLLRPKDVRYYVLRGGEVFAVDCPADSIDQSVYLLLADLSAKLPADSRG